MSVERGGRPLRPIDKSLFYYGKTYQILLDPLLKEERNSIINLIPEGSKVLDVGCGTGTLCRLLKERKNCEVVGVDLSLRMIDFAQKTNPYNDVTFLHREAGSIADYEEDHFDFAVMSMMIHELPWDKQLEVLTELMRLAKKTIIVDNNAPLPVNIYGLVGRMIEATFGRDHHSNFKAFIAAGGITGISKRMDLESTVTHRLVVNNNCRELVVLALQGLLFQKDVNVLTGELLFLAMLQLNRIGLCPR